MFSLIIYLVDREYIVDVFSYRETKKNCDDKRIDKEQSKDVSRSTR